MTRDQFIRALRKLARGTSTPVYVDRRRGKGSHWGLVFGDRETVIPHGELAPGTLRAICAQLGIGQDSLRR